MQPNEREPQQFTDFTERAYRTALQTAKSNYEFTRYPDRGRPRTILWRHDVDVSIHRALALAKIEHSEAVTATYFIYLRSAYYNIFAPDVSEKLRGIVALGHEIGLHFDPAFYGHQDSLDAYEPFIERERTILFGESGVPPVAISFHNFGLLDSAQFDAEAVCGMVNAYGRELRDAYDYTSDSNGVWRFRRLQDVLEKAEADRLQVLTHPEWWTPEVIPPRARLQRAIDGYAAAMGRWYDELTAKHGRPNIR